MLKLIYFIFIIYAAYQFFRLLRLLVKFGLAWLSSGQKFQSRAQKEYKKTYKGNINIDYVPPTDEKKNKRSFFKKGEYIDYKETK